MTAAILTLVCDGHDARQFLLSFSNANWFSWRQSFVQNISRFSLFCPNSLSPECYISQADQCNVVFDRTATRQLLVPLMCQSDLLSTFYLANIAVDKYPNSHIDYHSMECKY